MFGQGDGFVEFYNFMARFMDRIIEVRGGELMAKRMWNWLPKASVWYYWVDSLVVSEEVVEVKESAAWKAEEGVENLL